MKRQAKNQVIRDKVLTHREMAVGLVIQTNFLDLLSTFLTQLHQYPFIQIVGDGLYVNLHSRKHPREGYLYVLPANYYFTLDGQPFTLFHKHRGKPHELFYSMTPDLETTDLVYQPYLGGDDNNRPFSDSFQKRLDQAIASSTH